MQKKYSTRTQLRKEMFFCLVLVLFLFLFHFIMVLQYVVPYKFHPVSYSSRIQIFMLHTLWIHFVLTFESYTTCAVCMVVSELLPPFFAIAEDFNYKNMFPIQYEKAPKTKWFFYTRIYTYSTYTRNMMLEQEKSSFFVFEK